MRVIVDLHIHGKYSRATSSDMDLERIARFSKIKGLTLVGTGDFTHPRWLYEVKRSLVESDEPGLYKLTDKPELPIYFMVTGEVSTIFEFEGKTKKIHHVILTPGIDVAEQVNDRLSMYGDLEADGRPTLNMSAPHLVEEVLEVSKDSVIFPAHAWTPWFSIFGAFSGFDSVDDCYQDMARYIYALETGLSSDPPMNWRLSSLDRFTLLSNSDSHSYWPWRIGREANVFEVNQLTYKDIVDSIRKKDASILRFTIETDPAYGKYHWTGHRACGISLPPAEAIRLGGRCPVCHKTLTKGVEQRVEELADRPYGSKPAGSPGYIRLLPLSEVISAVIDASSPNSKAVWAIYNMLISRFGDEYTVLLDASFDDIAKIVDPSIAEAIIRVREGRVKVIPGYDGVYGRIIIFPEKGEGVAREIEGSEYMEPKTSEKVKQKPLTDFF
ncbi:MAG: endonuclease Q family protein [Candidatus Bathyarchaeota archaeon]|nr:endonuclease Q family protein [Candidatus Bathyarchaeota archaeon]